MQFHLLTPEELAQLGIGFVDLRCQLSIIKHQTHVRLSSPSKSVQPCLGMVKVETFHSNSRLEDADGRSCMLGLPSTEYCSQEYGYGHHG
jgi:hypothetical protein